jgi:hypothetical protein
MPHQTARAILTGLQRRVDARDLDRLAGLFTDDPLLIGIAAHHVRAEAVHTWPGRAAQPGPADGADVETDAGWRLRMFHGSIPHA